MPGEDRLTVLCEQSLVTGIDFVQVVDPDDQTVLRVFFYIDPDQLDSPIVNTSDLPENFDASRVQIVSIDGGERLSEMPVVRATWLAIPIDGATRTVLEVETSEPGDFSIYRITIDDPAGRIDRFFNSVEFSFKQGCPGRYDCKPDTECPDEEMVDFAVDYLARDFQSIRGALLDFASQRYPTWTEQTAADVGVMLAEIMAALGDEFSYIQDRYGREAYLETLNERRSLRWLTRLVDYRLDDGKSAATVLAVMASSGNFVEAGMRVWAPLRSKEAIPFEIGRGLRDQRDPKFRVWIHPSWNSMPAHVPDESAPCLPIGSTELFLRGAFPIDSQLPAPIPDPTDFWLDRQMILKSTPADPSLEERRHLIRITDVSVGEDPLCLVEGAPLPITRIRWAAEHALPFELCLRETTVCGNVVPAIAGETFTEAFVIAGNDSIPNGEDVAVALEREGPCNELDDSRSTTLLHSLAETENLGLGWAGSDDALQPEVEMEEIDPVTLVPGPTREFWGFRRSLLNAGRDSKAFTLDDGIRRRVIGFHKRGEDIVHRDYASGFGFTIRFGDGEFGQVPTDGTVFRVRYRSGPGAMADLPPDTVTLLSDPSPDPMSPSTTLETIATSVTNPFPITEGRDQEAAESIKRLAPEAFRALTLRAVRDEDYREIAERLLPWVQRAGATARWTGSWLTEFATADPLGAFALSAERRSELENVLDCVRQVGREVYVTDPVFVNLDLEIKICVASTAYPGQVEEQVVRALTAPGGFFNPDNFTFGTPLRRSALEATIQAVPGVRGVEEMCLRARGFTGLIPFVAMSYEVADDQIIRLQNHPRLPERGSLRVKSVSDVSCLERET